MIRKKVGNSEDVDRLAERYGASVSFIWINDWSRLVLAMNDALREGKSLALQCDRPEYSSKKEGFEFFGERRSFPFTIYHLAIMHGLPVVMSFAVPAEERRDDDGSAGAAAVPSAARSGAPGGELCRRAGALPKFFEPDGKAVAADPVSVVQLHADEPAVRRRNFRGRGGMARRIDAASGRETARARGDARPFTA